MNDQAKGPIKRMLFEMMVEELPPTTMLGMTNEMAYFENKEDKSKVARCLFTNDGTALVLVGYDGRRYRIGILDVFAQFAQAIEAEPEETP